MSDHHYILKVLSLNAVPKVVSIGLTSVSFTLMVRALGASEYGTVVYIIAIVTMLESFVDFGVSSAAGKEIAAAREAQNISIQLTIRGWARLQSLTAIIGLIPLLLATYFIAKSNSSIAIPNLLLVLLVFGTWVTISWNFSRACLTSLLAFRELAYVDIFDSLVRSGGSIIVAFWMPTATGLGFMTMLTAIASAIVGAAFVIKVARRFPDSIPGRDKNGGLHVSNTMGMLKESGYFLWLRLATRTFQSLPLLVFEKIGGVELVGVVSIFGKIVDILNFPFNIIGNALAVRAQGVVAKGASAVRALWDAAVRFVAVSLLVSATCFLTSGVIAKLFVPNYLNGGEVIAILSVTIFTTAISSVISPMSDYIGALRYRNMMLTVCVLFQIPVIWISGVLFGGYGAITGHVSIVGVMVTGYVLIALKSFFSQNRYYLRKEVWLVLFLCGAAFAISLLVANLWITEVNIYLKAVVPTVLFWSIVLLGGFSVRDIRQLFMSKRFFDFTLAEGGKNVSS